MWPHNKIEAPKNVLQQNNFVILLQIALTFMLFEYAMQSKPTEF